MADQRQVGTSQGNETPLAIGLIATLTLGLTALGWFRMGTIGALSGALGGVVLGLLAQAGVRAMRMHRELEPRPVPKLAGLPPDQAMHVLSAMATRDGVGPALTSPLLRELARLREDAKDDLASAIPAAEALREDHPRSAAVEELLVGLYVRADRPEAAQESAARGIRKALDGGMNSVAHRIYLALDVTGRDELELEPAAWTRLAAVLDARAERDEAEAARARSRTSTSA